MKHYLFLSVILWVAVSDLFSRTDSVPTWLDTIPPVVTVLPEKRIHATPFSVSLKANENATIWVGIDSPRDMVQYKKSITISKSGRTVVYFYAEDMYGNRSRRDTAQFILDFQPPRLTISPDPGVYRSTVTLQLSCDEPCRLFRHNDPAGKDRVPIRDKITVSKEFTGYISAVDRAGNIARSDKLHYVIDTATLYVLIEPRPGIYNYPLTLSLKGPREADLYYSFDPNATSQRFTLYKGPVRCPYGLTLVRYFARNKYGNESAVRKARFVIDTIPPKIRHTITEGKTVDRVELFTKEKAEIRYALDEVTGFDNSLIYTKPIEFQHKGRAYIKALARDKAGNMSKRFIWERRYDKVPPTVRPSHVSSTYTKPFTLTFTASEPAKIFYTLDNSAPDENALVYRDSIPISKSGYTVIRYIGIDQAANKSTEGRLEYILDSSPPKVKARIEGSPGEDVFYVILTTQERAKIYYEIGDKAPTPSSTVYRQRIPLKSKQVLRYFAVDEAGNRSDVYLMDDLLKPMVSIVPKGGVYRTKIPVSFTKSMATDIYWRHLPDTTFNLFTDTIRLEREGSHTIEYYSLSPAGMKSPVRQVQYLIDWTPPRVNISVKKGVGDSVSVFFECNENASIYYTIDGTSPFFSNTTRIAGNKFNRRRDRISISRQSEAKLAFFAEDVARNQSSISVLDIFKPRAIPNIPSGVKRVYNRILSLSLNTYDDRSQIYFERHGRVPTLESPLFKEPITLVRSDTIKAFVVDASGYRGETETFIYLIDLPPSPNLTVTPEIADVNGTVTFDASGTFDQESHISALTFQWDFNGDGTIDAEQKGKPIITHRYRKPGKYTMLLSVIDRSKRKATLSREVLVRGVCPENMVFVPRENGRSFCIDKYEWPNKKGKKPRVMVSWIRAKMYCYDEGKRLCTAEEWQYACSGTVQKKVQGTTLGRYPYGRHYEAGRCPTEGEERYESGKFTECNEKFGTFDMLGNVWEWVADKLNGAPVIVGGSFEYGNKAHCALTSESSLTAESRYTGFRCCR